MTIKKRYLLVAITISLLIHFFAFLSSYIFEGEPKKSGRKKEEIIEIIPYYPPPDIKTQPSNNFKAFGAKDIITGQENKLPEISKSIPKILEEIERESFKEKGGMQDKVEERAEEPPKIQDKIPNLGMTEDKKTREQVRLREEKTLPNLKNLIPKSTDLLSKLPKEETINLDTGDVKGSKELILNTKEYKYLSYLEKIKRKIEAVWRYPEVAKERGIGGRLKITFSISRDGKIENKVLIQSSGYSFLDDAAMKALRDASPLAPFPKEWDIEKINIDGTFIYQVTVVQ